MPRFDDVACRSHEEEERLGTEAVLRRSASGRPPSLRRRISLPAALFCLVSPCYAQQMASPPAAAAPGAVAPTPSGGPASAVPKPPTAPAGNAAAATPADPPAGQAPRPGDPFTPGSVSLPPPPDAANPTPAHVAEARRLILATGISRSFTVMVAEFMDQIGNTFTQAKPELVPDMNTVLDQLRPEFDKQSDEMIDRSARIYATLLSEKDIDTILAFYNSLAGRRYVSLQPLFLNQLLSGTQAWQQKIAINMMARVREEMKKKGHDLQ